MKSYQKEAPPLPLNGQQTHAEVLLSLNVTSIEEVSEVDSSITIQFTTNLKWREAQLRFKNLKKERFLNTVSTKDAEKIWYPKLLFFNTRYKVTTTVNTIAVQSWHAFNSAKYYSTMISPS